MLVLTHCSTEYYKGSKQKLAEGFQTLNRLEQSLMLVPTIVQCQKCLHIPEVTCKYQVFVFCEVVSVHNANPYCFVHSERRGRGTEFVCCQP